MGKGRPRKEGERYPGGKLKPDLHYLGEISPTEVRRIADHGVAAIADRRLAGEVGRLLLVRQLSTLEAAAAWRIGEIYGRYERLAGRNRSTRSPSYEMGVRSTGDEAGNAEAAIAAHDAWHALQDFIAVHWPMRPFTSPKVAPDHWRWPRGNRVRETLETLCVDERSIGPAALYEIRAVLQRIASEHFEIVRAVKKPKVAAPPPSAEIGRQLRTSDFGRDLVALFEQGLDGAVGGRVSEVRDFASALLDRQKFRAEKKRARSKAHADG